MRDMDLSLVSLDDLWEEFKRRSDAVVLIELKTLDESRESSRISYKGGQFTCLGMIKKAEAKLLADMLSDSIMEGEE